MIPVDGQDPFFGVSKGQDQPTMPTTSRKSSFTNGEENTVDDRPFYIEIPADLLTVMTPAIKLRCKALSDACGWGIGEHFAMDLPLTPW